MNSNKVFITSFSEYLKNLKNYSEHTVKSYTRDIIKFFEFPNTKDLNIANIDNGLIKIYISSLHRKGMSPKTLKRNLSSLRSFFEFLEENKHIDRNPTYQIATPKVNKKLPEILQYEDILSIVKYLEDKIANSKNKNIYVRDLAIFELFYSCGLRVSELTSLHMDSIDYYSGTLRVIGKGKKERVVPIGSKAISAVKTWVASRSSILQNSNALFITENGNRISNRSIQHRLNLHAKASGVEQKLYPHKLRHTVATHLLESSGNIRAVQEFLGHENISTTQVYTQLDNQYLMKIYEKSHPRAKKG